MNAKTTLATLLLALVTAPAFADVTKLRLPESSGKPPAVPLTATDPEARRKQVSDWLKTQYPDFDPNDPACKSLTWFMNAWLRPGVTQKADISDKYFGIAAENFNKTQQLSELVAATKLPAVIKAAWRKRLAEELIELRLPLDIQAEARRIAEIPTDGTLLKIADESDFNTRFAEAFAKAYPNFSRNAQPHQVNMLEVLIRSNPGLRLGGFYVTATPAETRPHILITGEGEKPRVYWLRVDPSAPMLLPPFDWLSAQAAKITPTFQESHTFSDKLSQDTYILNGLLRHENVPVELHITRRGKAIDNIHLTTPTLHNLPHRAVLDRKSEKPTVYAAIAFERDADLLKIELNEATSRFTATRVAGVTPNDNLPFQLGKAKPVELGGDLVLKKLELPPTHLNDINENWTWWRGPNGTNASQVHHELVEKFQDARLVWVSDLETPKGRGPDTRGQMDRIPGEPLMGGWASPIVADNRVFLSYYVPSGKNYAYGAEKAVAAGEDPYLLRINLIDADDVVHAFDARTGKTLWKRTFPDAGLNPGGFNKSGPQLTPAYANGRVFAIGCNGNMYGLDAATGDVLWQSDIDRRARISRAQKTFLRSQNRQYGARSDFNSALIPVADVVVTCDYAWTKSGDGQFRYEIKSGLMAFDQATGVMRWHLPNLDASAASPWRHNNTDYLVSPGINAIHLIEARTGKIVWTAEGIDAAAAPPVFNDIVLVNIYSGEGRNRTAALAAYKLNLTKPEKLWQAAAGTGYGDMSAPILTNNAVWFSSRKMHGTKLADGSAITLPDMGLNGAHTGAPGRIIGWDDIGHQKPTGHMIRIDGDKVTNTPLFLEIAASYDTSIHNPIVDGRLIVRMVNRMLCYDLRAKHAEKDRPHTALLKAAPRTANPPVPALPAPKVKATEKSPLQDLDE